MNPLIAVINYKRNKALSITGQKPVMERDSIKEKTASGKSL